MSQMVKRSTQRISWKLLTLFIVSLFVWGCGGGGRSSYDTPQETDNSTIGGASSNVIIEASTLKSWIDAGLVNNETDYGDKVVIIDFNGSGDMIPGAIRVAKTELMETRFEGVADATNMVATPESMDAAIQRLGIDQNTTIVFTGTNIWYQARAYWTFRYYGFPRSCLRILNGLNNSYSQYGLVGEDSQPTPTPSTYSIRNLEALNDDFRASIGEMISIISSDLTTSTTDIVFDARGDGATSTYVGAPDTTTPAFVFHGHPAGGLAINQPGNVYDADSKYLSAAELATLFDTGNWPEGMKATVYCTTGVMASSLFVALDAILGVDVQLYDGSWSQLGLYSDNTSAGGQLPSGSPWAVDSYMDPTTLTYNADYYFAPATPASIASLYDAALAQTAPFTGNVTTDDSDVVASQIETADEAAASGGATNIPAPVLTATASPLIDGGTLFSWASAGLVNKPADGSERVVILDVSASADYAAGHIPGAYGWGNLRGEKRYEGPLYNSSMVMTPATFEAKLQAAGIDANTTIVLTSASSSTTYYPSRMYFHFRYWGFPKSRIKVLNGQNAAWPAELITTTVPDITPSALTLAELATGAQTQVRASLAEMMDAARDLRGTPVDLRGDATAAGSTGGVVFNGTINGGRNLLWSTLFSDGYWKTGSALTDALTAADISAADYSNDGSYGTPVLPYCTAGNLGSYGFFLFDGILGLDTMLYDGSWSQWGYLSDNVAMGGELATYSLESWAVDNATYMTEVNYSLDKLASPADNITLLNPDATALGLDPADAAANQIETIDYNYQIQAPAVDTTDSTDSGGSAPTSGTDDNSGC